MKYLIKGPKKVYKFFYSQPNERKTRNEEPEPAELLSEQEIELEVKS